MSKNRTIQIINWKSPVGELIIGSFEEKICLCDWRFRKMRGTIDNRVQSFFNASYSETESKIISKTISELEDYFSNNRQKFDIPLLFAGTEFQQSVWKSLLKIEYGNTASYMDLSKELGNVKAIRAVASANGANAISILVPCHRIIGTDGSLTGYAGGLPAKKKLLELEGARVQAQMELF